VPSSRWVGARVQVLTIDPEMGGEDFSQFGRTLDKVPLCLFRLGAVAPEKVAGAGAPVRRCPRCIRAVRPLPEPTIKTGVTALDRRRARIAPEKIARSRMRSVLVPLLCPAPPRPRARLLPGVTPRSATRDRTRHAPPREGKGSARNTMIPVHRRRLRGHLPRPDSRWRHPGTERGLRVIAQG